MWNIVVYILILAFLSLLNSWLFSLGKVDIVLDEEFEPAKIDTSLFFPPFTISENAFQKILELVALNQKFDDISNEIEKIERSLSSYVCFISFSIIAFCISFDWLSASKRGLLILYSLIATALFVFLSVIFIGVFKDKHSYHEKQRGIDQKPRVKQFVNCRNDADVIEWTEEELRRTREIMNYRIKHMQDQLIEYYQSYYPIAIAALAALAAFSNSFLR